MIICDTGPLIALAKADQLNLLAAVHREVIIAPAVHREALAHDHHFEQAGFRALLRD